MAEKYLEQLNYSKAEEYFLEAREIDPKKPEPYKELYRIYTDEQVPEKADKISDLASENLSEKDLSEFHETIASLKREEKEERSQ